MDLSPNYRRAVRDLVDEELLRQARERLPSRSHPGEPMSRQEVAHEVNLILYGSSRPAYSPFNANYLGKLERGEIRWPQKKYRDALRAVLRLTTDEQLGFYRRPVKKGYENSSLCPIVDTITEFTSREILDLPDRSADCLPNVVSDFLPQCPATMLVEADPSLVSHWIGMLNVLSAAHNVFGPRQIHNMAVRESVIIRNHRRQAVGDIHRSLLGVEARWAEFASWTAENLGSGADSYFWLNRAHTLAQQAGDSGIVLYVLMRQAQQAVDRDDVPGASFLAGQMVEDLVRNPRDRALCEIRVAQAATLKGDRRATAQALRSAYRLVGQAERIGDDQASGAIGQHCVHQYVQAHEGYCLLRLGDPQSAIALLEDVLLTWSTTYRLGEALTRAWLANAYAATGRHSEAAAEGYRTLMSTPAAESVRSMRELARLNTVLGGRGDDLEVQKFQSAYDIVKIARRL